MRSPRCNGIKNTASKHCPLFSVCHRGRVANLAPRCRCWCLSRYSDNTQRAAAAAVVAGKKGHRSFFFVSFFGLPGSAAACGPEGASGFTRRPSSLGPRRPSAQARPSGGQDGEGRGARKNRMKGNPHCERASGVRVLHVWWSSS